MGKLSFNKAWGGAAAIFFLLCSAVRAETPLEVIEVSNQEVLDIYSSHSNIDEATEDRVLRIIDGVTNFESISNSVVGRFCKKLTPAQCREFKLVFTRLLRASSIRKLGRYRPDSFDYLGEDVNGSSALVKTVAYYKEDLVAIDYQMELFDSRWMIVNYVVDDVDAIRNYRKQFTRILAKETFEQLLTRLNKKIEAYEQERNE